MTMKKALRAWLEACDPNAFLTFNFGYAVTQLDGDRHIKHFFNALQSKAFGRNWAKLPADERISAIGAWEHLEKWSNPHCHVGATVPARLIDHLVQEGPALWISVSPRGQLDVSRVRRSDKVVRYSTKGIRRPDDLDRLFIYSAPPRLHNDGRVNVAVS